jgi:hypothetical protein
VGNAVEYLDEALDEYEAELGRNFFEAIAEYEAEEIANYYDEQQLPPLVQFYAPPVPRPEPVPDAMPVPPPIPDRVIEPPNQPAPNAVPQQHQGLQFPPLVQVTNHIRNLNIRNYYGSASTTTNNMSHY